VRALVDKSMPLVCYACHRQQRGLPRTEAHHIGGHHNPYGFVRDVDANLHRLLSLRQNDRPPDLSTPVARRGDVDAWWAQIRAHRTDETERLGGAGNELTTPVDIRLELERLRLRAEFDRCDLLELIDGELDQARGERAFAVRDYRRWRQRDPTSGSLACFLVRYTHLDEDDER
jgi:hypothetical protein